MITHEQFDPSSSLSNTRLLHYSNWWTLWWCLHCEMSLRQSEKQPELARSLVAANLMKLDVFQQIDVLHESDREPARIHQQRNQMLGLQTSIASQGYCPAQSFWAYHMWSQIIGRASTRVAQGSFLWPLVLAKWVLMAGKLSTRKKVL